MRMEIVVWMALMLLVGILLGALIARRGLKPNTLKAEKAEELKEALTIKDNELEKLKAEVSDHFVETAALVNQLTQSYKAVYEHLEKGAYHLVGEETLQKRLSHVETEPVMLEYLGHKRSASETLYVVALEAQVTEADSLAASIAETLGISETQAKTLLERAPGSITKAISYSKAEKVQGILEGHGLSAAIKVASTYVN